MTCKQQQMADQKWRGTHPRNKVIHLLMTQKDSTSILYYEHESSVFIIICRQMLSDPVGLYCILFLVFKHFFNNADSFRYQLRANTAEQSLLRDRPWHSALIRIDPADALILVFLYLGVIDDLKVTLSALRLKVMAELMF